MRLVAKMFVVLNEVIFIVLAVLPLAYLAAAYMSDFVQNDFGPTYIVGGLLYYILLIITFGWLSLVIENNRNLKEINASLKHLASDKGGERREPAMLKKLPATDKKTEPTLR